MELLIILGIILSIGKILKGTYLNNPFDKNRW